MTSNNQPVLFYVHIPKTAGTTMKLIILWLYRWNEIFWAKSNQYIQDKLKRLSHHELDQIKMVAGHTPFGMHEHFNFPNFKYFTILRDPYDRVISQYYYMSQKATHRLYKRIHEQKITLERLLTEGHLSTYNVQTFWLTGADKSNFKQGVYNPEIVRQAKDNIDKYFAFVGLNDQFDESLILMKRKFNWSWPMYARKNVNKSRKKKDEESQQALDLIAYYNKMDIEVYDYCKQKFNNELAANWDTDFKADLDYLNKLNRNIGRYKPYRAKLITSLVKKQLKSFFTRKETLDVFP